MNLLIIFPLRNSPEKKGSVSFFLRERVLSFQSLSSFASSSPFFKSSEFQEGTLFDLNQRSLLGKRRFPSWKVRRETLSHVDDCENFDNYSVLGKMKKSLEQ